MSHFVVGGLSGTGVIGTAVGVAGKVHRHDAISVLRRFMRVMLASKSASSARQHSLTASSAELDDSGDNQYKPDQKEWEQHQRTPCLEIA